MKLVTGLNNIGVVMEGYAFYTLTITDTKLIHWAMWNGSYLLFFIAQCLYHPGTVHTWEVLFCGRVSHGPPDYLQPTTAHQKHSARAYTFTGNKQRQHKQRQTDSPNCACEAMTKSSTAIFNLIYTKSTFLRRNQHVCYDVTQQQTDLPLRCKI